MNQWITYDNNDDELSHHRWPTCCCGNCQIDDGARLAASFGLFITLVFGAIILFTSDIPKVYLLYCLPAIAVYLYVFVAIEMRRTRPLAGSIIYSIVYSFYLIRNVFYFGDKFIKYRSHNGWVFHLWQLFKSNALSNSNKAEDPSSPVLAFYLMVIFLVLLVVDVWFMTIFCKLWFVVREQERIDKCHSQHCPRVETTSACRCPKRAPMQMIDWNRSRGVYAPPCRPIGTHYNSDCNDHYYQQRHSSHVEPYPLISTSRPVCLSRETSQNLRNKDIERGMCLNSVVEVKTLECPD